MQDGPFCRGLPRSGASVARHRPFTVDSIVPQHLFGSAALANEEEEAVDPTNQATQTLNNFLENFYDPKQVQSKVSTVEGRLDFHQLPIYGNGVPPSFSLGLPDDVFVSWDGAWQAVTAPPSRVLLGDEDPSRLFPGQMSRAPAAAARLNGALGMLRFSRPVVLRRLLVRPPQHASVGRHRLLIRARKAGKEVWRSSYDFDAEADTEPNSPSICRVGDLVNARWAGDGRRALAVILSMYSDAVNVRWLDNDHTHRLVPWKYLTTPGGVPCLGSRPIKVDHQNLWQDLARRTKSADEISFAVPFGAEGWLLSDLALAATRWSPPEADSSESAKKDAVALKDPCEKVVQVFPGPCAVIVEASRAAVLYHADDMLERGLRLRGWPPALDSQDQASQTSAAAVQPNQDDAGEGSDVDSSANLHLHPGRSVEGLFQFIRALADQAFRLPPHTHSEQLLLDLESLVNSVDPRQAKDKTLKRYRHFEAWFAYQWDWLTPIDTLEVAFERWRRDPATSLEARGAFVEGQVWLGSYFCTQGPTSLSLNVTSVERTSTGEERIEADLSFIISTKGEEQPARGRYVVAGRIDPFGRALTLSPVPGSWKDKPNNFVMVGLQGIVSRSDKGGGRGVRFAGSVPIFGCDSFELASEAPVLETPAAPDAVDGQAASASAEGDGGPSLGGGAAVSTASSSGPAGEPVDEAWRSPLLRLRHALVDNRRRWREKLHKFIGEKTTVRANLSSQVTAQLVEAARRAGVLSFEVTTEDGEEIIVRIGQ